MLMFYIEREIPQIEYNIIFCSSLNLIVYQTPKYMRILKLWFQGFSYECYDEDCNLQYSNAEKDIF